MLAPPPRHRGTTDRRSCSHRQPWHRRSRSRSRFGRGRVARRGASRSFRCSFLARLRERLSTAPPRHPTLALMLVLPPPNTTSPLCHRATDPVSSRPLMFFCSILLQLARKKALFACSRHIHLNEPGRTEWEGFDTGTRAAAVGGVTIVVDMPLNNRPTTVSKETPKLEDFGEA